MFRKTAIAALVLFLPLTSFAHSRTSLHDDMRKLWIDHVMWTRMFIVSAVAGLPDQQVTTERLLQNQADIGNAVAGFYGRDAGDKLTPKAPLTASASASSTRAA